MIIISHAGDSVSLNGDAQVEIKLITERVKIKGPLYAWNVRLQTMNDNISFIGSFRNDTTFMYRDTVVSTGSHTYFKYGRIESCVRKHASDSVVSVHNNHFRMAYHQAGAKAGLNDNFGNAENIIYDESYSYDDYTMISPDTSEVHSRVYLKDCQAVRPEGVSYIGFKFKEGERVRLGWLKINASQRTIGIEEVAVTQ
jgi:hypothetical protein